jgi:hypothetical protein
VAIRKSAKVGIFTTRQANHNSAMLKTIGSIMWTLYMIGTKPMVTASDA